MRNMTLEQIRTTFHAGGLVAAQVVAVGRGFFVQVDSKSGDKIVLVRHSDTTARAFSGADTALKLLRDIGFQRITVDMTDWQPKQSPL